MVSKRGRSKSRSKSRRASKRRRILRRVKKWRGSIPRSFGIPPSKIVEMEYFAQSTVTTGGTGGSTLASAGNACIIRMNSPYDPSYASTGTFNVTAAGYRLWAAMYNHYCVLGSKCTMDIRNISPPTTATHCQPIVWTLKLDDNATIAATTWYQNVSDLNTKYAIMYHNSDNSEKVRVVAKYSPRKFFSLKDPNDNETVGAQVGNNPSDQCYAVLSFQSLDGASNVQANTWHSVTIRVKYRVLLCERKDVADLYSGNAIVEG